LLNTFLSPEIATSINIHVSFWVLGVAKALDVENRGPALPTENSPLAVWAIEPRDTGFLWGNINMRATTQNIKQYNETEVIFYKITNMRNTTPWKIQECKSQQRYSIITAVIITAMQKAIRSTA
jgi:hypothetical protein